MNIHRLSRRLVLPATALIPWSWFVCRDIGGGLDGWFLQVPLDLVALWLPVLGVGAAGAFLVAARRRRPWVLVAGSWVLFVIVATTAPWRGTDRPDPNEPMRIVFANLLLSNDSTEVVEGLPTADADVIITAETNGHRYLELTSRLGEPVVSAGDEGGCSLDGPGECASLNVWSRHPAVVAGDQSAAARARGVRLEIAAPSGPVVVYAVHASAPSPFGFGAGRTSFAEHRDTLAGLLAAANAERVPTIVVGDLNMSDRQSGYRDFARSLRDALRETTTGPTGMKWYLRPLFLRIDHLFVPKDWCSARVQRFSVSGSDHRGIAATVGPCPTGTTES